MDNIMNCNKSMGFTEAISSGWTNKWNFTGKASRSEFWWNTALLFVSLLGAEMFSIIFAGLLSMVIPSLPMPESVWIFMGVVTVILGVCFCGLLSRRMNDTRHSPVPGIALVVLTPFALIGVLFLLVVMFPHIADLGVKFTWQELVADWQMMSIIMGSSLVCAIYVALLVYVTPLLFKKGVDEK